MVKKVIKHHTPRERMELRRRKRKLGPAAIRRKERRVHLQRKSVLEETDV